MRPRKRSLTPGEPISGTMSCIFTTIAITESPPLRTSRSSPHSGAPRLRRAPGDSESEVLMGGLSNELRKQAGEAFYEYEQAVVTRVLKRPDWKLDAAPLERVLATGDERKVRDFIDDLRRGRHDILNSVIA